MSSVFITEHLKPRGLCERTEGSDADAEDAEGGGGGGAADMPPLLSVSLCHGCSCNLDVKMSVQRLCLFVSVCCVVLCCVGLCYSGGSALSCSCSVFWPQ